MADVDISTRLTGVTGVLSGFSGISGQVTQMTSLFRTLATLAAGGGLAAIGKTAINTADEMGKMSQRIGVAVEDLSALKFAAELADVQFSELTNGLRFFSRSMDEARRGTLEYKEAYDRLNVTVVDGNGNLRNTFDVMADVADRFQAMADGATKTALAQDLFGRTGANLITLLNQGGEALRAYREEAEKFGLIITRDTAQAAERFNDAITRLNNAMRGAVLQAMTPLIPVLAQLAEQLVADTKSSNDLQEAGIQLVTMFKLMIAAVSLVTNSIQAFGKSLGALLFLYNEFIDILQARNKAIADNFKNTWSGIGQIMKGDIGGGIDTIKKSFSDADAAQTDFTSRAKKAFAQYSEFAKDAGDDIQDFSDLLTVLFDDLANNAGKVSEQTQKLIKAFSESGDAAKKGKDPLAELKQELERLQIQYITLTAGDGAAREFELMQGRLSKVTSEAADALRNNIRAMDEHIAAASRALEGDKVLKELREEMNRQQAEQLDEARAAEEAREKHFIDLADAVNRSLDPMIEYNETVREYIELLNRGLITQDAFNKKVEEAAKAYNKAKDQSQELTDWQKRMLDAVKGFSTDFTREIAALLESNKADWEDFRDTLFRLFRRAVIDAFITQPLVEAINKIIEHMKRSLSSLSGGGSSGSSLLGSLGGAIGGAVGGLFGGGGSPTPLADFAASSGIIGPFQHGGILPRGFTGLVGEAGPELITPASTSRIVPNDQLSGGTTVIVNQTFQTGVSKADLAAILPRLKSDTIAGVLEAKKRGGRFSQAF